MKVGNLNSLRTVADVRDAVRAYFMLVTVNPIAGAYYNIGGVHSCTVGEILETLKSFSPLKNDITVEIDPDRLGARSMPTCKYPTPQNSRSIPAGSPRSPYEKTLRDLLDYWRDRIAKEGDRFLTR